MMTENTVPGGKAIHADAYVHDLDSAEADSTSEVDITYRHDLLWRTTGVVAQRGRTS